MAELVDSADLVYHLAAAVGVELIVDSPVRTIENNVHTTEVVLAAAGKKKKPVFVASTSEVYGKSTALPFQEDGDLLLGPTFKGRWSYACSKAIDEFLALAYWKERGLPTVIGRMFNTVGPTTDRALRHGCPELRAPGACRPAASRSSETGTQSRCFCHVQDVVRALAELMERDDLYGEVFNIGSEEEITIADLADAGPRPGRAPMSRSGTCPTTRPTSRASRTCNGAYPISRRSGALLGWSPTKSLDEIVLDVKAQQLDSTRLGALAALMNVGIVGLGYVGLPLAVAFCEAGHDVIGVDVDPRKIGAMKAGESYIEDVPDATLAAISRSAVPEPPLRRALTLRRGDHRGSHAAHEEP